MMLCHVMSMLGLCYVMLCYIMLCYVMLCIGGDLAPSLGDGKHFLRNKFSNDLFKEKISILTPKISDDLF